jgi:hypothetical protein
MYIPRFVRIFISPDYEVKKNIFMCLPPFFCTPKRKGAERKGRRLKRRRGLEVNVGKHFIVCAFFIGLQAFVGGFG